MEKKIKLDDDTKITIKQQHIKKQNKAKTLYHPELQTQGKQLSTPTRTSVINSPSYMLSSVSNT